MKQKHAVATFFVIGSAANESLGLLKREYDEGNEIGNHTYTHPRADDISRAQLELELNLTERLFESTLGVKTLLFRPPYGIDHQPETAGEVASLPLPQSMGYLLVGARIDPHDWGEPGGVAPAPAQVIAQRVIDQAKQGVGNIVLLHDGGGDRSAHDPGAAGDYRRAARRRIPTGFGFGPDRADARAGDAAADVCASAVVVAADTLIFNLFEWLRLGIAWIFMIGIVLVSGRALIIGVLALIEKLRAGAAGAARVPAAGERAGSGVQRRRSDRAHGAGRRWPAITTNMEVVVVNDGSSDRTGELLDAYFGDDPRVRILHQSNRGKSAALTRALREARNKILVTIDADTVDRSRRHCASWFGTLPTRASARLPAT